MITQIKVKVPLWISNNHLHYHIFNKISLFFSVRACKGIGVWVARNNRFVRASSLDIKCMKNYII